jgi:putative membrane protein insertion efficiency factor
MKTIRGFLLWFLKIYQKFFTLFSYGSCRYYPTCSEYARWQIKKNNILSALLNVIVRILKCNQLFKGGFDYPVVKLELKNKNILTYNLDYYTIKVEFWFVPRSDGRYFLLKSLD